MKIMSFNVRADSILDPNNRWKRRSNLVYKVIQNYNCDIIGLQEVTEKMYDDLIQEFSNKYNIIGAGRSKRCFNERNNLLVKNKYSLTNEDTFWLSKTPNKVGSSVWYSLFPRICTTSIIEIEKGKKIRVYNTHLDCLLPSAREYGLKRIGEYMEKCYKEDRLPCILMGDFNAGPNSKVITKFAKGLYTSKKFIAVQESNKEIYNHTTMSHFKGKTKGMHIDYIFASEEFDIKNVEIVKFEENNKYPSDHYPIVAEISL